MRGRSNPIALGVLLLGLLPPPPADARTQATRGQIAEAGWTLLQDGEGMEIYERRLPESAIREGMGRIVVDLPPARVWRTLVDFETFPEFVPYVMETRIVGREEGAVTIFQRLDLPWPVQNRYYTLRFQLRAEPDGHYTQVWDLAPPEQRVECDCGVETPINRGRWDLQPLDGGLRTLLTYQVATDPGGRVPDLFIRFGNRSAIPRLLQAVRERSHDRRYSGARSGGGEVETPGAAPEGAPSPTQENAP